MRHRTAAASSNPRTGGQTWNSGQEPLPQEILALAVNPYEPGHVYAGTTKGVFRSTDGGSRFRPAGLQWSNRTWTLVFNTKTDPPTLYYGGEGAFSRRPTEEDGGT